ncbi:MAG: peptidyl-prolyl cis-trans isomerase [Terriglobia bacterium]
MIRFFGPNRKKWVKWFLIAALAILSLGMVLTLAPIGGGDETSTAAGALATIYGTAITPQNLQQAISAQLQAAGNDPQSVDRMAHSQLDEMIMQQALTVQAHKMGLEVSDSELVSSLHQIPYLYQNGQFIGMQEYQALIQEETGMAVPQFEAQLRQSILLRKLREAVTDEIQVTPAEVHELFLQQNEKSRVNYVVFEPTQFFQAVTVTPKALNAYFLVHQLNYKMPEQRQVKYVIVPPDAVRGKVQVTDAEMQDYYNQHMTDYSVPDRVKAAHILFKTTGENAQQQQQTLELAQKVLAKVKAGGNFAELAKKYSQDPGSAQNGGELGWIQHGQTVKPFEDAAFSMKPGEISNLVRTEYGYHIIKVEDKQTAHLETFDEVKGAIQATLEKQMLQQAQNALAAKIQDALKANPQDFDAIAKANGLAPGETPLFAYDQTVPDLGNNQAFENLSFQLPLNTPGQAIQVPKGVALIMITKIVPEHLPTLSEAQTRVEQDYRTEQSKLLTTEKARQFAQQTASGNFAKTAQTDGYKMKESADFTQQQQVEDAIPGSALAAAFTMKPGQVSSPVSIGSTYVVFQVVSHTPANEVDFSSQTATLTNQLVQQKRDLAFQIYEDNLKQQLMRTGKLKINTEAMKTFLAGYQSS